ncbi:hypothetical protein [Salinivibrio costicola]|uniref:hypothetical protein n=1 Tax=Salinivibrio costicola TaxID=51367 RepID=UPI000AFCF68E|nr:hypothetical protein [Salinivibrio costicola]
MNLKLYADEAEVLQLLTHKKLLISSAYGHAKRLEKKGYLKQAQLIRNAVKKLECCEK